MASVASVLGIVRKVLGKLTDILTAGRAAGLWNQKPGVPQPPGESPFDSAPHRPGGFRK